MKFLFYTIILLVSINSRAQDNFKALYNINFMVDTVEINKKYKNEKIKSTSNIKAETLEKIRLKMRNQFLNTVKIAKNIYFNLDFNKNYSKFYLPKQIETDKYKIFKRLARYNGQYYSFKESLFHEQNSFGQDFIVIKPKLKWEITNISKKIGKYNCFKAITQKKIESPQGISYHRVVAWFAPEIPFNFGPKGYGGLPGLIVRLDEGNLSYTIKSIKKIDFLEFKKPTKGKEITEEEFTALSKKMYENRGN